MSVRVAKINADSHKDDEHFESMPKIRQAQRINRLTPELNPSAQRRLMRFFTGEFAS
jgi:hypothetical protein